MERVTKLLVSVHAALDGRGWVSGPALARAAGVHRSAIRKRLMPLVAEGLIEQSDTRPLHYRMNPNPTEAHRAMVERIRRAAEVFE